MNINTTGFLLGHVLAKRAGLKSKDAMEVGLVASMLPITTGVVMAKVMVDRKVPPNPREKAK